MHEPEIICTCGDCEGSKLTRLGEDVTEVLEKIPARLKVIRHVRPRYARRKCEAVFQAPRTRSADRAWAAGTGPDR